MKSYDVIVIGLGVMGSSTCFQLAKKGAKVLGLEQFDIPHGQGSSLGYSKLMRQAYFEHPDYVPLLRRASELWQELEVISGKRFFHQTGVLCLGRPEGEVVSGCLRSAERYGLKHRVIDRAELAAEFPQFEAPGDFIGFYEEVAGVLLPEPIVAAYANAAMLLGAELHGCEAVEGWSSDAEGVSVRTTRQTYRAKRLIVCSGPWTSRVVKELGVELSVTRQAQGWLWPAEPELFQLGRMPAWAIDNGDGSLHYGFPMLGESPGFKIARHGRGKIVDLDSVDRGYLQEDENDLRTALKKHVPKANGSLLSMRICLYTNSADHHFILDRHPSEERVFVACGFSGHGFKFGSVLGEAMAEVALTGRTDLPIEFLGLKRFSQPHA